MNLFNKIFKFSFFGILTIVLLSTSCKKEVVIPTISTAAISNINQSTATSGGNITNDGGAAVTARGVCWSTQATPSIIDNKTIDGAGIGNFTSNIVGLTASTAYYVRAYATNSIGTGYGPAITLTTAAIKLPQVATAVVTEISQKTAICGGNITSDGGGTITARGVCWSTSETPTIADGKTNDGEGLGSFNSSISGLTLNTAYYVSAYATNEAGTAYGTAVLFTTNPATIPSLITGTVTEITQTSAICGGLISSDGGANVTARGVCWSTTENPNLTNSKTTDGQGIGSFSSNVTALIANTTYYLIAYATNSAGTGYGSPVSFTTSPVVLPVVTTAAVNSISHNTATGGGNVSSDGGGAVVSRGVCWSTSIEPTIADNKSNDGIGIGTFASSMTGLLSNTTYYVRAYASNSAGPAYGLPVVFKSLPEPVLPTVWTDEIEMITQNSATCGGNVTDDGGAIVTTRGICYSTSPNPTTVNQTLPSGNGKGNFSVDLTGLMPNTTYYVRAYATNSAGTAYGSNNVNFTTLSSIQGCTNAPYGLFPSYTIDLTCDNTWNLITSSAFTGEYSKVNVYSGRTYWFASSYNSDVYTITNESGRDIYGVTYHVEAGWTGIRITSTQTIRVYRHDNFSCGVTAANTDFYILCGTSGESIFERPNPKSSNLLKPAIIERKKN